METAFPPPPAPTARHPLLGLTLLVVEDSRFASEALRLLGARSGARVRRAETLAHARRHLMVYRPDCVIVDLGLPDGAGEDLIAQLADAVPRIGILLGMSGAADGAARALAAGADGYLAKPLGSVAEFQALILSHLPLDRHPPGPRALPADGVMPDPVAYRDDLYQAAGILARPGARLDYVTQFLGDVADGAGDDDLTRAIADLAKGPAARARLAALVDARLRAGGPM